MATTLPVPIEFELPDGWHAAPPDEVGAPGAAFVALRPGADDGFTANIAVDGEFRTDDAPLGALADASVAQLRAAGVEVEVVERSEKGSAQAPGLLQELAVRAAVAGVPRDLVQTQVYVGMLDTADPGRRVVIRLVLTATRAQQAAVIGDFEAFVRSVRPDGGAE
jgi:hypothetical protein